MKPKIILFSLLLVISAQLLGQNLMLKLHSNSPEESQSIDTLSYINTHTNYNSVTSEIQNLSTLFNNEGYFDHKITDLRKTNDSLFEANISLNKKYTYIYIKYTNIPPSLFKAIGLETNPKFVSLTIKETKRSLNVLNLKLSEQGLPFSTLQLTNIRVENDSVKADLKSSKKEPPRRIDKIIVKGYEKFPKKFIKHYARIKTGDIFNMETIKKKTNTLNKLPFANLIRDTEVLFTNDSTVLYLYVEKQKSNNFDGYLGFTTNENTNKLEFSGYLNMTLRNNLNYGESINLLYRSDENEQKTFNINVDAPYIFKSPIGANVELNIFKKDSSFTTIDQSLDLYYQFKTEHTTYLGITSSQSNNLLQHPTSTSIDDYNSTFYQTKYNFTRTDETNILFPVKSVADIHLGIGNRTYQSTKENQFQYNLAVSNIFYLNHKNSIYSRVVVNALQSDTYLENELLRFGGINSIRGFEENSLVASFYSVFNLEYRLQLSPTIFINSITDFSYFENQMVDQKEKLIALGIGFAILTKAGLLKMNYANGKTENSPFNISDSKVHLSITSYF
ncbi:POTRA domain-containing protein [Formosa sp. 4Alg 33]|uniref:POTRA domain-containing protein n=1 Tax=Formosa sp. 4Alg 33 TaxID=3382189 RepID=UPI003D9C463B